MIKIIIMIESHMAIWFNYEKIRDFKGCDLINFDSIWVYDDLIRDLNKSRIIYLFIYYRLICFGTSTETLLQRHSGSSKLFHYRLLWKLLCNVV